MRATIAAAATAALVLIGAPAIAAPGETVPLSCDNGKTYQATVNGNGDFTPGRIIGATSVLVPIAFQNQVGTATPPQGDPVTFPEPDSAKGGGAVAAHSKRPTVTCEFALTFTLPEDDPESGLPAGTVLSFTGEVVAFLTGR